MTGECGAYYGTGRPHPHATATCRRPEGHPPISEDGIGHNPDPVPVTARVEPTADQSWCDLGRHAPVCSGYTEDEADPETCMCECHDATTTR